MTRRLFLAALGLVLILLLVVTPARGDPVQPEASLQVQLLFATFDPVLEGEPAVPLGLRARPESTYALLQFRGPPRREWLDAARSHGVVFYDYVPQYTYMVRLPASARDAMSAHPAVRWIGPLHPAYKISPWLDGNRLLLDLFPDADRAAAAAAVRATGAQVLTAHDHGRLLVAQADRMLVPALAAIEQVRWVQAQPQLQALNDEARWVTQGYERGSLPLYKRGITGAGQVGAIADSGLDAYDFEDASGARGANVAAEASCYFVDDGNSGAGGPQRQPGPSHRKIVAYTVPAGAGGDFTDDSGHGTHVVGSAVGDRDGWGAVSPADGMAYAARLFFQDLGKGLGAGISPPADYRVMFNQAYDASADGVYQPEIEPRTHSNSWGGLAPSYEIGTARTDEFVWSHPDFLILFAMGNQGPGAGTIGNPAVAKNVVSVGASENGQGQPENMASFSSHGPVPLSNRLKPTISAPGEGVRSAFFNQACATLTLSGTSMATPVVHGVALLMRQYLWDGFYPRGEANDADRVHPSAALLKALLINSGRPMSGAFTDNGSGGAWPSNGQGWGRVVADDSLYFQGDHRALWLEDEYALDGSRGFQAVNETRTYTLTVGDGSPFASEPLELTLAWTDYPGAELSNGALVNDLDLTVTDPLGRVHFGNDKTTNDFSSAELPDDPRDSTNPWEVVYLKQPVSGTYVMTVTAANVPSIAIDPTRRQGFALVASGDLLGRRGRAEIERQVYSVSPTAEVELRVSDLDLNTSAREIDQVTVAVTSTSSAAGIALELLETAADSRVFAGQVALTTGMPSSAQELRVTQGDVLRVAYRDADDGSGRPYVAYDTALIATPTSTLLNPPLLASPGAVSDSHTVSLSWSPAETDNGHGTRKSLAYYEIEESQGYRRLLYDDAEGALPGGASPDWDTSAENVNSTPWTQSTAYAHSPVRSYWSGQGEGSDSADITTTLTLKYDITIPVTLTEARLTFYSRYYNDPDDTGSLFISTDSGATWSPLFTLKDAPVTAPSGVRMQFHEVDLSSYIGKPIRLRLRYGSGARNYSPYISNGWWVDDLVIEGGSWRKIATIDAARTSWASRPKYNGDYAYRIRAIYTDGAGSAWSNFVRIAVRAPQLWLPVVVVSVEQP